MISSKLRLNSHQTFLSSFFILIILHYLNWHFITHKKRELQYSFVCVVDCTKNFSIFFTSVLSQFSIFRLNQQSGKSASVFLSLLKWIFFCFFFISLVCLLEWHFERLKRIKKWKIFVVSGECIRFTLFSFII